MFHFRLPKSTPHAYSTKFSHNKQRVNENLKDRYQKLPWIPLFVVDTSGVFFRPAKRPGIGKGCSFRPYGNEQPFARTYGKFTIPQWLYPAVEQHLCFVYAIIPPLRFAYTVFDAWIPRINSPQSTPGVR